MPILMLALTSCVTPSDKTALQSDINNLKNSTYQTKKSIKDLNSKLQALQSDLRGIKTQSETLPTEESIQTVRNSQTALYTQVSDLQQEVQELRGAIEESTFFMQTQLKENTAEVEVLKAEVDKLTGPEAKANKEAILGRLETIEAELVAIRLLITETPAKSALKKDTPKSAYDQALKLFKSKKFVEARSSWLAFIKRYPNNKLAGNSQFWVAETFYSEGDYDDAILAYDEVITNYPKSPKLPAAMLKQAYAFLEMGDTKAAKGILQSVIKSHPKSNAAKTARKKLDTLKTKPMKSQKEPSKD